MDEILKVVMADMKMCEPPKGLTTLGLGSCVGVVIYDVKTKVSGMIHVMLPDSTKIRNNTNRNKFADTGIQDIKRTTAQLLFFQTFCGTITDNKRRMPDYQWPEKKEFLRLR